ncbi:hypothetical protein CRG98_001782 [Punica granatum]|uniref:Subtilisin-like protease fibronectin type-III domain-containing protein n=1 Tax=Punica granatum TaxID=22663 RepID=A0A2I0LAW1_PUNGR|nr:hypothetical protein CRG98_001782 [Punica granatum]
MSLACKRMFTWSFREPERLISLRSRMSSVSGAPLVVTLSLRGPPVGKASMTLLSAFLISGSPHSLKVLTTPSSRRSQNDGRADKEMKPWWSQLGMKMDTTASTAAGSPVQRASFNRCESTSAIKSALMTTTYVHDNALRPTTDTNNSVAGPWTLEAGHVNPRELNYPSFTIIMNKNRRMVRCTRELTNVGDPRSIYRVAVVAPPSVAVEVQPRRLVFGPVGDKKRYTVTFTAKDTKNIDKKYGSITWEIGSIGLGAQWSSRGVESARSY